MTNAIEVKNLSKKFRMYRERNQTLKSALLRGKVSLYDDFWALQDIDFCIPKGSTFGLIGSNGSGKSTLLKCLAKIYWPDIGSITYSGKIAAMLEVGSGFHQELTGRENIYLNGSILGMSKKAIDQKLDQIIDFSGVEKFIDQPVKNYSSGMFVRLGFSVAINVDPEILVVDEVLAVGDEEFQNKCISKFADLQKEGKTIVLVTHSMETVKSMCNQVAWIEQGQLMEVGSSKSVTQNYLSFVNRD